MPSMSRSARALFVLLIGLLLGASLAGCATRTVRHSVIKRHAIEVDLVRQVAGFTVEKQGHEHPAIISTQRLSNILAAIEVETPAAGQGTIRQPAFPAEMIEKTAEGLAQALAEASPDEEVGVKVIRTQARLGLFSKKYLTTFLAYVDNGQLYLLLRRVDWPIKESDEKKPWPEPHQEPEGHEFPRRERPDRSTSPASRILKSTGRATSSERPSGCRARPRARNGGAK